MPNHGRFSPGNEPVSIGLDKWEKYRPPPGFDPRTAQPVASRYTDCPIPAHVHDRLSKVMSWTLLRPRNKNFAMTMWQDTQLTRTFPFH